MKKIKAYVKRIDEELEDAQEYAERYVMCKAKNAMGEKSNRVNYYKEMAQDELKHATYLHGMAVYDIEELNKVYIPTQDMLDKWDKLHKNYVEKEAMIRKILEL